MSRWVACAVFPVVLAHCVRERAEEPARRPEVVAVTAIDAGGAPAASASEPIVASGTAPSAGSIPGDCRAAAADAEKRRSSMKPATESIDLDGDGTPDCMFTSCTSLRCRTLLYLVERGHVRLVGDLTTSLLNEPRCVEPRAPGRLCRLSVHVMMIHGDEQEYFYEYSNGAYVEAGVGRRTDPERYRKPGQRP